MSHPDDIERLIINRRRRLQKLKELQALKGVSVEPSVLIEIEDLEASIAELEAELKSLSTPDLPDAGLSESRTPTPPPSPAAPEPDYSLAQPRPSWLLSLPRPKPIPQSSQMSARLKGYPLFSSHRAERELGYLFGEVGCFWSGHPVYRMISASSNPQVILAPRGGGKTACANALSQVGDIDGHLSDTLPGLPPQNDLTIRNSQKHIVYQLFNYVYTNPGTLLKLNQEEQSFLLRLLIREVGVDLVKLRLSLLLEYHHSLATIFDRLSGEHQASTVTAHGQKARKYSRVKPAAWLQQVHQCLNLLGFNQCLVVIDFDRVDQRRVNSWLNILSSWANNALIVKLFLPDDTGVEWPETLDQFEPLRLSWSDDQLLGLARWRFNSLARLTGNHFSLEAIFDDHLYQQFIQSAQGNPGRLARLWRYLFEDHLSHNPDQLTFSVQNLDRAVEKLNDTRYS